MKKQPHYYPAHERAAKKILTAVLKQEIVNGMTVPALARRWGIDSADLLFELVYLMTGKTVRELKSTAEAETPVLGQ